MVGWVRESHRLFSPGLALLVAGISVGVPLLDGEEGATTVVVESGHDPARCSTLHDHTLCTQIGAGKWLPSYPAPVRFRPAPSFHTDLPASPDLSTRSAALHRHSRAPPRV